MTAVVQIVLLAGAAVAYTCAGIALRDIIRHKDADDARR